jgi:hypothetical protein
MDWKALFIYDETSPSCLIWNPNRVYKYKRSKQDGKQAGTFSRGIRQKYYRVNVKYFDRNKRVMVHRIIWEMFNFPIPHGFEIDHIDGDSSNNRIENLRCVPMTKNKRNATKPNKHGLTGVSITDNGGDRLYATASWTENKKQKSKRFSIDDFGYEEAMRLAKEYRLKMIEELNAQGAGYTERHIHETVEVSVWK